jgi:hypothetical protein
MKQFVFGFCAVLALTLGPVRVAAAQYWWRHPGPGPMGAGADKHFQWTKSQVSKPHLEKPTPLYTSPKSVGWWHKSPGPMGAGADRHFQWTTPHIRKSHLEKPTPPYTSPKSVGFWRNDAGTMGVGSGN